VELTINLTFIKSMALHNLTDEEIEAEWKYRVDNRLGNLCRGRFFTPAQLRIAVDEANHWKFAAIEFRKCVQSDDASRVRSSDVHLPDADTAKI
jgi:hypothetical protein